MKVLTVRQPWASLISLGVKQIETRSWSTSFRGPLAIHAGKAWPVPVGEWQVPSDRGPGPMIERLGRAYVRWESMPTPLGAVVAVCDLIDVVPIVDHAGCRDGGYHLCVASYGALLHSPLHDPWPDGETEHDVSDQLPFGDFTPGRFAWLLDNVRLIDPVPMKGAQGLRDLPEGVTL